LILTRQQSASLAESSARLFIVPADTNRPSTLERLGRHAHVEAQVDVAERLDQRRWLVVLIRPAVILDADGQVRLLVEVDDVAGVLDRAAGSAGMGQLDAGAGSLRVAVRGNADGGDL